MVRHFPYLNKNEIDFYFEQYYPEGLKKTLSKRTLEVSMTGPKYSHTFEKDIKQLATLQKLDLLIEALRNDNELTNIRPNEITLEKTESFIYETVSASKIFFPKSTFSEIYGLNYLVVWIAEPDIKKLSKERWVFTGSFLYLIESLHDEGTFRTTLSGCSSLQALANIILGKDLLLPNSDEPFGRNDSSHPIEKLKKIGGVKISTQTIDVIYRKRYISDEQCFVHNGHTYRCNDILGYPLYIDYKD